MKESFLEGNFLRDIYLSSRLTYMKVRKLVKLELDIAGTLKVEVSDFAFLKKSKVKVHDFSSKPKLAELEFRQKRQSWS
jgi:hypothetical protein